MSNNVQPAATPTASQERRYRAYIDRDLYTKAVHVLSSANPPCVVDGPMRPTTVVEAVVRDWLSKIEGKVE